MRMNNLEHLIENGLSCLNEGKTYKEWRGIMQQDCNWEGNENITIDNLWEICQYVIFTWDLERTLVRCKDCAHWHELKNSDPSRGVCKIWHTLHHGDWFCRDGQLRG